MFIKIKLFERIALYNDVINLLNLKKYFKSRNKCENYNNIIIIIFIVDVNKFKLLIFGSTT